MIFLATAKWELVTVPEPFRPEEKVSDPHCCLSQSLGFPEVLIILSYLLGSKTQNTERALHNQGGYEQLCFSFYHL